MSGSVAAPLAFKQFTPVPPCRVSGAVGHGAFTSNRGLFFWSEMGT